MHPQTIHQADNPRNQDGIGEKELLAVSFGILCHVHLETALADAYYAACIMFPEQFADVDPVEKAGELFTMLLGTNPYEDLKEDGYEFRTITIGE